mgnify:CR=1 FL=1
MIMVAAGGFYPPLSVGYGYSYGYCSGERLLLLSSMLVESAFFIVVLLLLLLLRFFMVKLKNICFCELLIDSTLVRMSMMLSPLFD